MIIFSSYAYAFYIGSQFVQHDVYNTAQKRTYSGGDVLATFFGVIIGVFSLGQTMNHYKTVKEGCVAAKLAFDIIERKPTIDQDDKNAVKHTIQGSVELRNVNFYYPTRPDTVVLKNLSVKFEKGKTTAIVGPSGAGKSSIAQLIERFYDPSDGQVLIDGNDIKTLNLNHFRQQIGYVS